MEVVQSEINANNRADGGVWGEPSIFLWARECAADIPDAGDDVGDSFCASLGCE